ncbi:methyltransferase [Polynucleobacter paneuropaeus]|nr:methyltransferase [Polynucleobacter paneuropaeus]
MNKALKEAIKNMLSPEQIATAHKIKSAILGKPKKEKIERLPLSHFGPPFRLHLGCGNVVLDGFCNVDIMDESTVDFVDDISTLSKFKKNSVSEIYSCHVLEHFSHKEILPILSRWFEALAPSGVLRISVPDIDRIVRVYHKNFAHFEKPGHTPWIGLIYGGQTTPYDFHKTGFNFCWLKYLLEQVGFQDCQEYPHEPHFVPGTTDGSLVKEPFGEFLSLNMMAIKPKNSLSAS